MKKMPIDIRAVMDAASDIGAVRELPIMVAIYMDEASPRDLQAVVRAAFATSSEGVRVSMNYYPGMQVLPDDRADMSVVVAGAASETGLLVDESLARGIPTMVVTKSPFDAMKTAADGGHALFPEDVVYPRYGAVVSDPARAQEVHGSIPLDERSSQGLRDRMGEWVVAAFREKRLALAAAFPFVRRPLAAEAIKATSIENAAIGFVAVIPGADMPIMTMNQMKMLLQIAAAYGEPLDAARIKELAFVLGGGFACRSIARQFVGLVPCLGWAFKSAIGYAGTLAAGRAAVEYFEAGGSIVGLTTVVGRALESVVSSIEGIASQGSPGEAFERALASAGAAVVDAGLDIAAHAVPTVLDAIAWVGGMSDPRIREHRFGDLARTVDDIVATVLGKGRA